MSLTFTFLHGQEVQQEESEALGSLLCRVQWTADARLCLQ